MADATRPRGGRPAQGEPVLDRAFRMLGAFGPAHRALSLTSLSARAGLPKPTALRLARKLVEWGALERTADGRYVVGVRLLEVASLAPRGHGLRATALPYLEDLHQATGQHVLLAVRDGLEAILVERLSAHGAGQVLYRVGGRMPLHSTGVGLVLLAHAPAPVQDEILAGELTLEPEHTQLSAPRPAGPAGGGPPGRRGRGVPAASGGDDLGRLPDHRPAAPDRGRAVRGHPVGAAGAVRPPPGGGRGGPRHLPGGLRRAGPAARAGSTWPHAPARLTRTLRDYRLPQRKPRGTS